MSDAFQDRENTFEKQFVHDEDLHFRAVARRNKALALWVADMKGLSKGDAEKYADQFVGAQVGRSDDDVAAALREDLARGDIDLSDHRLRKKMDDAMAEAMRFGQSGEVGRFPSVIGTLAVSLRRPGLTRAEARATAAVLQPSGFLRRFTPRSGG